MVGKYADLHENETPALDYNGSYSTPLFANKTIDIIEAHNASSQPLFIYLAFQSVHSPLQAPAEWIEKYSWIEATSRRTLAAMTSCMDYEISRIVASLKGKDMWTNTLLVMVADNGGPPYVANSNWPMRGGKWTMWEVSNMYVLGRVAPCLVDDAFPCLVGLLNDGHVRITSRGARTWLHLQFTVVDSCHRKGSPVWRTMLIGRQHLLRQQVAR